MGSDREAGFYWVTWKMHDGSWRQPEVRQYDGDVWRMAGDDDFIEPDEVSVLTERLEPPPTFHGIPLAFTIFKPYTKPPDNMPGRMPERGGSDGE